jgi:hypothetical protein
MCRLIFTLLMSLISFSCRADSWHANWAMAVAAYQVNDFEEARLYFDLAVEGMEAEGDLDHPHVYVDRAKLKILLNLPEESLSDLDKALANKTISNEEMIRALKSRSGARLSVGMDSGALQDLETLVAAEDNKPVVEYTDTQIIVSNLPNCHCYQDALTCRFIHAGLCLSKKDVTVLKSGICLIQKVHNCGCTKCNIRDANERICDVCGMKLPPINPF